MKNLFEHIEKTPDCWIWTKCKSQGYGICCYKGKKWRVHRLMWTIENGSIPENMCVLHKCDNPSCVNPSHLFIGTQLDNIRDMVKKKRNSAPRGMKNKATKLTDLNVLEINELIKNRTMTQQEIANIYGVSQATISAIKLKKTRNN